MAKRPRKNNNRREDSRLQFRINGFIRVPDIRLVGDNLDQISEVAGKEVPPGIYPTRQAQQWANKMELDLVEISPKADPPVCKIIGYQKFLYDKKKKEKEKRIVDFFRCSLN